VKVKVGHPGTIVDYLGVIRIPRVSGLIGLVSVNIGWLNIDIFFEVEALLFTANMWCGFRIYFLV
jgi:hypothetical protein